MNSSTKSALSPYIIAVTGVIGSGKTTFVQKLKERGFFTLSADSLAREVVEPHTPGLLKITEVFGAKVLHQNGTLDRKKLGDLIFGDLAHKQALEQILHPLIRTKFEEQAIIAWRHQTKGVIFYDIPLYFENTSQHPWIRKVVVVSASKQRCVARVTHRDNVTAEKAEQIISNQIPIEEKEKKADFVVRNDQDSPVLLDTQLDLFLDWLQYQTTASSMP